MKNSRVEQTAPVRNAAGKWACTFRIINSHRGEEYVAGELTSAHVWFDAAAATVAGKRALDELARTEKYPNLCEIW